MSDDLNSLIRAMFKTRGPIYELLPRKRRPSRSPPNVEAFKELAEILGVEEAPVKPKTRRKRRKRNPPNIGEYGRKMRLS